MSNTHLISPVTDKRARNRLLFLVAFGWLVLGATNVPNKQQQISGIAAEQSNVARTPVQETIDQQKKSALPYKPVCEQPDDQAEYILCASIAQAAAADRANQISSASLRTNEVGIALLLLTLFATAWAAYAASRATKVAERLIDGSERPYLIVEFLEANFSGADAPQDFLVVKYRVRNVGGSVAIIDLYRDCLGFNSNLPEDWRRHLGGSNIAFIEKDGFMDTCVDSSVTQSELRKC